MRVVALACVALLASVLGRGAGPSEPKNAVFGESFRLAIGESARIEAGALEIGFEDVPADSRCPKGEQCIREGDATVRVWLQEASEAKETHGLHTSPKERAAVSYLSFQVRLLRLDPHPVTGRTIAREDYRATFEATRGSSAPPESR